MIDQIVICHYCEDLVESNYGVGICEHCHAPVLDGREVTLDDFPLEFMEMEAEEDDMEDWLND